MFYCTRIYSTYYALTTRIICDQLQNSYYFGTCKKKKLNIIFKTIFFPLF